MRTGRACPYTEQPVIVGETEGSPQGVRMKSSAEEGPEAAGRPRGSYARPPGEIWSYVAAALFAAFFLVTSIQIAAHRPLWFDEIITVLISRLPPSKLLEALAHTDNNMPALHFLVVHWFDALLKHREFADGTS